MGGKEEKGEDTGEGEQRVWGAEYRSSVVWETGHVAPSVSLSSQWIQHRYWQAECQSLHAELLGTLDVPPRIVMGFSLALESRAAGSRKSS